LKIYVAGHKGLVGSALARKIDLSEQHSWIGAGRSEVDLFDRDQVLGFLGSTKPDAIVIAAAKVGGIGANKSQPVEFLAENLSIQQNLLSSAHDLGVERVLFLGSSCIYPKFAAQPIKEDSLLTGPLEPTNEAYALAKISGLKLVDAYRSEYQRDWISAMPCNIYGFGDNFNLDSGHVLPSLIKRFHDAKLSGAAQVKLWGSGTPLREFLFADDLAEACLFLLENYHSSGHINVGSGKEISIKDLAALISSVVGYSGEITWDENMPDGTPRKVLDTSRLTNMGWQSKTSIDDGVVLTYQWFKENQVRL
jgi:GDP-L-fucose synthase